MNWKAALERLVSGAVLTLVAGTLAFAAEAQTLRIGMQDDADTLDPVRTRSLAALNVLVNVCDPLIGLKPDLSFEPRLATGWTWSQNGRTLTLTLRPGVVFHDGEIFDAQAVKYNLDQTKTLPDSFRKTALALVEAVTVVDKLTVSLTMSAPDASLISQLAFTPGMMVSPRAAAASGNKFGLNPVCAGPYRFVERVAQDRIVIERFPQYWNRDAYPIERVVFLPIADQTVRFANLRSGDLQLIERLAPTDVQATQANPEIRFTSAPSYGYYALYVNINNGPRSKTPVGQDKRVRQALEAGLERDIINEVVFEGYAPGTNQPFGTGSPWYLADLPVKPRDVAKARRLLREAGITGRLSVEVEVGNIPASLQLTQLLQAMWAEIGVDIKINTKEFATLLKEAAGGNFEISQRGTGGYSDPDGMFTTFISCTSPLNDGRFCHAEVDRLLKEARAELEPAKRKPLYDAVTRILLDEMPVIYLYQQAWLYGHSARLEGFAASPAGQIRLEGVSLRQ